MLSAEAHESHSERWHSDSDETSDATPCPFEIFPDEDVAFYYKQVPVYSGLEALRMIVDMDDLDVELANHGSSAVALAHLYNATV